MSALRLSPAAASLSACALFAVACASTSAQAARSSASTATVPIRMAEGESVPACVTPARLMAHVLERTPNLDPAFRDIARFYKQHGDALRVRWDYAFYQMLIETNYLSYKTGAGRWGDVNPRQNNFAGIGTTGGGVPGDAFKDVSTGVLGQIQHLVAYSGERVANPVAPRTVLKQDEIIEQSLRLKRPVRFSDLARRWAVDWRYGSSIEYVAQRYRKANCTADGAPLHPSPDPREDKPQPVARKPVEEAAVAPTRPSSRPAQATKVAETASPMLADSRGTCGIWSASYGGDVSVLIRSIVGRTTNYTVLQVDVGVEDTQARAFIDTHAVNGEMLARFPSKEAAFSRAFELCPRPS
jgi:hypothetical protein